MASVRDAHDVEGVRVLGDREEVLSRVGAAVERVGVVEAGREVRTRGNEERQAQAHEARILRSGWGSVVEMRAARGGKTWTTHRFQGSDTS